MIATGQENTLPPNLVSGSNSSKGEEDPFSYVRGALTAAPTRPNPYQPGNLIWIATPSLKRTSNLSPNWIGPFQVLNVSWTMIFVS